MKTFGGDLFDTLEGIQTSIPATSKKETRPAKAFLGFLMNFAIRQGNVETILALSRGIPYGDGIEHTES